MKSELDQAPTFSSALARIITKRWGLEDPVLLHHGHLRVLTSRCQQSSSAVKTGSRALHI